MESSVARGAKRMSENEILLSAYGFMANCQQQYAMGGYTIRLTLRTHSVLCLPYCVVYIKSSNNDMNEMHVVYNT